MLPHAIGAEGGPCEILAIFDSAARRGHQRGQDGPTAVRRPDAVIVVGSDTVQAVGETRVDEHGRSEPPRDGTEAATLLGFLDYQRATLRWKCRGLSDEQLRMARPPSPITLGGLLKHMACVEDSWFTEVVGAQQLPEPWASVDFDANPDWTFRSAAADSGDALRALWADRVNRARAIVSEQLSDGAEAALKQDHPVLYWGDQERVSLRWVLTHMIEEYARHNGHADLIRESIDGQTGE